MKPWPLLAALAVLGAGGLYASGLAMAPGSFSRHMGAHLLLSLGAAPLLVLGWPRFRPVVAGPLAFLLLNAVTYGVHLPVVYARLMTPAGMLLESLLFLGAGAVFWLRVAAGGLGAAGLLLAQMAACALLGAAITFSRSAYAMTTPGDTALGGVLMWVVGGFVVMAAAFYHLLVQLSVSERRHEQAT
ncbi:cytochrome c oxidase assembly protein [Deinococcus irradiatisoli]|uniref:cytochrome c oxidase assembly protein n=1 Tax=Deinococcus irradiatisoli TaxID=2202254 RepID=UPI001FE29601|nr:cytochrome c oxidase assembly protein [Deinococcus irradiatisoli]